MIAYILFNGAVIITGFIGNLLIVLVFALNRVFHNMRSFILASLALSDFLMVTINLTCRVISVAHKEWIFGKTWCYGLAFLERLCFINTLLHLCAVSYERYRAIVKDHLTYDGRVTAKKIIICILVLWVLPTVISLRPFFDRGTPYEYSPELYGCTQSWRDGEKVLYSLIALFVGPFVFMFVLNYEVFKVARRIKRQANIQLGSKTEGVGDGEMLQLQQQFTSQTVVNCQQEDEENVDAPISPQEEYQKTGQRIAAEENGHNTSELRKSSLCKAGRVELENELPKSGAGCSQERSQHGNITVVQSRVPGSNMKIGSEKMQAGASEEQSPRQFPSKHLSVTKCKKNTLSPAVVEQRNPVKNAAQGALQLVNILKEYKAAKDVLIITGAFLVCYFPVWIHGLYRWIEGRPYSTAMLLSVDSLFGTTCIWNPIIYSVRKKEFRKAVKRLFKIHN